MVRTKLLAASALALVIGAGTAVAQSNAPASANQKADQQETKRASDQKALTPNRPIRRVGSDSWPASRNVQQPSQGQNVQRQDQGQTNGQAQAQANPPQNRAPDNGQRDPQRDNQRLAPGPNTDRAAQSGGEPNTQRSDELDGGPNNPPTPASAGQQGQQQKPSQNAQQNTQQNEPAQQNTQNNKRGSQSQQNFASIRLGTDASGRVAINSDQQHQIASALRKHRVTPAAENITVHAGMSVPVGVQLNTVSADFVEVLPQFRGYSFFATRDEIAVVEPASLKVVATIPVRVTATASTGQSVERTVTRTTTRTVTRQAPARRTVRREVTVGVAPVERDVVVEQQAPATVYETAPAYRAYPPFPDDEGTVVIESGPRW